MKIDMGWDPWFRNGARAIEERRRKRRRREALAKAELEFAVGRPLVDIAVPIIGARVDLARDQLRMSRRVSRRQRLMAEEVEKLMVYFADQCKLTRERTEQMVNELAALLRETGDGRPYPMYSPASAVPTLSGAGIPRL